MSTHPIGFHHVNPGATPGATPPPAQANVAEECTTTLAPASDAFVASVRSSPASHPSVFQENDPLHPDYRFGPLTMRELRQLFSTPGISREVVPLTGEVFVELGDGLERFDCPNGRRTLSGVTDENGILITYVFIERELNWWIDQIGAQHLLYDDTTADLQSLRNGVFECAGHCVLRAVCSWTEWQPIINTRI